MLGFGVSSYVPHIVTTWLMESPHASQHTTKNALQKHIGTIKVNVGQLLWLRIVTSIFPYKDLCS